MVRQGRYTKKRTPFYQARSAASRRWRWFRDLPWWKKTLLVSVPIAAFLIITPILTYAYYYNDIADQDRLMNRNNTGIVLLDKDGQEFYSLGTAKHREFTGLDSIADITEKAVLASEDKDFYNHSGFSLISIVGALYANVVAGDATAYGGSTLTQQLAKNTLLSNNQTYLRKYQELTVAMAIEQRYSKDEILSMYLDSVYFGNNSFGISEAAENYFGKKPNDLTLAESAMLIGVLPAPSAYSPVGGNMEYAKERQLTVLSRMVKGKVITEAEKTAAYAEELTYLPAKIIDNTAPHFTEMVLEELYEKYGEEKVKRSGYQVTTSLDSGLQQAANKAITDNVSRIQAKGGSNASLVAIDPTTAQIRALVGSIDYNNESFGKVNMTTTKRQPGSSFKPIYYARAMADDTIAPATVIRDESTDFNGYKPKNASGRFYGDVSVRKALAWSLNIPAVKVMQKVGVETAVEQAKAMGVSTLSDASEYGLSLALGAGEVPLTEMTNAYATFANNGVYNDMTMITSIQDKYNSKIFTSKAATGTRAISRQGAYLISDVLSDNAARAGIFGNLLTVNGTDNKVKQVAVKTGTTDDSRDGWTIGYTPSITVGVWVGNNDNTAMRSGGADTAGPIWKAAMKASIGSSVPAFIEPTGVAKKDACMNNVRVNDYFLVGSKLATACPVETTTQETIPVENIDTTEQTNTPDASSGPGDGDTTDETDTTTPVDPLTPVTPVTPTVPANP